MRFIRKHFQQNIIKDDRYIHTKDGGKEVLEPEIFENVMRFSINTENFQLTVTQGDRYGIEEIIETANYFTFVSRSGRAMNCIKWDELINFEFEL